MRRSVTEQPQQAAGRRRHAGTGVHCGVLSAVAVCMAAACNGCITPSRSTAADVSSTSWERAAEVVVPNADTLSYCDLDLFLRCNERFAEDTLTLRIAVCSPDSLRFEERFRLTLLRKTSPTVLADEHRIPYRHHVRLGRTGDYLFRITPLRPVRGVEAIGIHIEKSE